MAGAAAAAELEEEEEEEEEEAEDGLAAALNGRMERSLWASCSICFCLSPGSFCLVSA